MVALWPYLVLLFIAFLGAGLPLPSVEVRTVYEAWPQARPAPGRLRGRQHPQATPFETRPLLPGEGCARCGRQGHLQRRGQLRALRRGSHEQR